MSSITPIPTTRVSNLLVSQTLTSQLQSDQTDLLNIEQQISTGQRIQFASQDPSAALRATSLQTLIQRKGQITTNVQVGLSYLGAADTSLTSVSNLLTSARGTAVSVAGATSSDSARTAAASSISATIQQLVDEGNQNFNGRYLFGGSATSAPFQQVGNYVLYTGNEDQLSSYSDLNQLFATNVNGNQVFGALSQPVQGADLNPTLTRDTKLSDLNGGQGVAKGSIAISDGTNTSVVDLSNANNLGQVVDAIESHPPAGRSVTVNLTSQGLTISLDAAGGGNLTIGDVGGGTTAQTLGIARGGAPGNTPIVGGDLNPQLTLNTPISDILGTPAAAHLSSGGVATDVLIVANQNGAAGNGATVNLVNDPAVSAGHELTSYDAPSNTFTVHIQAGATTANEVVNALNANATFTANYQAQLDPHQVNNDGTGPVAATAAATTSGGSGTQFDSTGLQVVNGGQTYTIDLSQAKTVQDVINSINGSGASLLAEVNPDGNGINVRSRLSGADFSIGENGGQTAAQLGLRTFTGGTSLDDLNHGLGVHASGNGADFTIQRPDGTKLSIDVSGAKTIQDVVDLINNQPGNSDPATKVTAQLDTAGNGIQLVANAAGGNPLTVSVANGSQAAQDLGLVPAGASTSDAATVVGGVATLSGGDTNPQKVDGVFDSLIRIQQSLQNNDNVQLQQAMTSFDSAAGNVTDTQAEVGAREQSLDALQTSLQTETTDLQGQLSNAIGTDIASAATDLASRTAAFQASLQLIGQVVQLTVLNYL